MFDAIAREGDGRTLIVDYKSDRLGGADPGALVEREYATQRLVYALAALRDGAPAVDVVHVFLETPESPVAATFTTEELSSLEESLGKLVEPVLRGAWAVTETPHRGVCHGCPAEGGLCSWPLEMTRRASPGQLF
jgi:hypothetical protein